jgi:hypothetical protein
MEIIKLPIGQQAPKESDCISVDDEGGRFVLNTSTLGNCPEAQDDEAESEAVIGSQPYDTYDEAEAAGMVIAAERCVETLYISRNAATPD